MKLKELNPFKEKKITVDDEVTAWLKDFATENYGNPFAELARIKVKAKHLLTTVKTKRNDKNGRC